MTFERLLALASCFILDGEAPYKADPLFAEVRSTYSQKIASFGFAPDNHRAVAALDPVRGLELCLLIGWPDTGQTGPITAENINEPGPSLWADGSANEPMTAVRPDVTPNHPPRATVIAVRAGNGAFSTLFEI